MASSSLPRNVRVISQLAPNDSGYSIADDRVTRALSRAEDAHFWFRSRNHFVSTRLARLGALAPARVLDLGCGGGVVTAHLERSGYSVTGVDGHLPRILDAATRAPGANFFVHDLSQGTRAIEASDFDVVGLFDVIEHLDTPRQAIEEALARVKPGGLVVGTVPSLMSLWSQVDVDAGHRLRYERHGLEALLTSVSDCTVLEIVPFNRTLVPLLWLQRRRLGKKDPSAAAERNLMVPPGPVNAGLYWLLRLEYALSRALDRSSIPGASLWFAVRRNTA